VIFLTFLDQELLDVWKKHRHENVSCDEIHAFPSTYAQVAKKDVNQDLFITAEQSIITYGEIFEAHYGKAWISSQETFSWRCFFQTSKSSSIMLALLTGLFREVVNNVLLLEMVCPKPQ
jgi:hypothetical protein